MASEQPASPESTRPRLISAICLRERVFGGAAGAVFRGMAVLATGSLVARVVGLAAIPVLTRIYGPEDFGVLAVFTALVAMLVPILTLRYVVAVPLPRHDGMAMNLMVLSTGLMFVMLLVIGLLLWAFGPALLGLMSMDVLAPWWWLILFGLMGTGAYEIMSMWSTRQRAYKTVAQTQVTQSVLGAVVKIGLGFLALKPFGLLLGQIAAQSGGISTLGRKFWSEFKANLRFVNSRRLKLVAGRYRGFPIYRLPSQFLLVFSMQAPLLFTAAFYGPEATGQLGLALMALALPINLLGQSMSRAYYAEIAKIGRRQPEKVLVLAQKVSQRLLILSIVPVVALFFWGSHVFMIGFGAEWKLAGDLASVLSIYLMFQFVAAPSSETLNVYEALSKIFILNLLRVIIIYFSFYISSSMNFSLKGTIILYSLCMSLYYIVYIITSFRQISRCARG